MLTISSSIAWFIASRTGISIVAIVRPTLNNDLTLLLLIFIVFNILADDNDNDLRSNDLPYENGMIYIDIDIDIDNEMFCWLSCLLCMNTISN